MKVSPVPSYVSCVPCPLSLPCCVSIQCLLCLSCVRCLSSTSCLFERSHSAGEPISSGSMTAWLQYRLYEGVPCSLLCLLCPVSHVSPLLCLNQMSLMSFLCLISHQLPFRTLPFYRGTHFKWEHGGLVAVSAL